MPVSVYNPRENGLVEQWNRMLKGGIQAFMVLDRPWEEGMTDHLAQHRHMPSLPQGQSPATLLLGWNTRMSFELPASEATLHLGGTPSGTSTPTMVEVARGAGTTVDPLGVSGADWSHL